MTDLIKASQSDWFENVLDYIGFAPSRFYLRESCRDLSESIPAQFTVSLLEFGIALKQKLVNPRNMYLSPNTEQKRSYVRAVSRGYRLIKDRKLRVSIMERTLPLFEKSLGRQRIPYTDIIEWDAWLERSDLILGIFDAARRFNDEVHQWAPPRSVHIIQWNSDDRPADDVDFCRRILAEWHRPQDPGDWRILIEMCLRLGYSRRAISFLTNESGLDLFSLDFIYESIADSGNVELMEEYLLVRPETDRLPHVDFDDKMIRLLVNRVGITEDILPDWFLRGAPNIDQIDFLIQRGADINATYKGWGYTEFRCLDIAFKRGQWDLIDELIKRGAVLGDKRLVFAGPILKDAGRFKKYLLDSRLMETEPDKKLLCELIKNGCLGVIADEIFSRIWDPSDLTIAWVAFEAVLLRVMDEGELGDFGPFVLRIVSLDSSVVNAVTPTGLTLMGVLNNPARRLYWNKNEVQLDRIWCRYLGFHYEQIDDDDSDADELYDEYTLYYDDDYEYYEESLGLLLPDWRASFVDPAELNARDALRQSLASMGVDPNAWFAHNSLARELSTRHYDTFIYRENLHELLDHGCDIDGVDRNGTALCFAAERLRPENLKILLEFGANVFKPDNSIPSAFYCAASLDNDSLIALYEHARERPGFDINAFETAFHGAQETAIHAAVRLGRVRNVGLLLDWGANPDLKTRDWGLTPLMLAVTLLNEHEGLEIAQLLIARNCDMNIQDKSGRSALFLSIAAGSLEMFEFLIESGADVEIKDDLGTRPLDLAMYINKYMNQIEPGDRAFGVRIGGYYRHSSFPGDRLAILGRLQALTNDPETHSLQLSDLEVAQTYGLTTISYILQYQNVEGSHES